MTTNHDALREAFNAFLMEQHERHKHQHNHFYVARNEWARRTQSTQHEALAASKPEPQAQAGEPEVVAWGALSADGNIYDVICPETHAQEPGDYTIALITLQSHREAMAQVTGHALALAGELQRLRAAIKDKGGDEHSPTHWMPIPAVHNIGGKT